MTRAIRAVPDGFTEIDLGMTNWDHGIDAGFEERLRAEPLWGRHAAREFNGRVWFQEGFFHEQVWRYGTPVAHYAAPTLQELAAIVSDAHGWE